ncbi:hypothetical protein BB560_002050 [Smittium megazygosporum]|uniref:Mis18 domain-containing protein n=1 Tax=Smittium megazygosporum TaxID=133381 RepID=A0A2T9ZFV5_9FUNG|nr:hypothetical protein BB560_002050 [Smittium megazygosporum]
MNLKNNSLYKPTPRQAGEFPHFHSPSRNNVGQGAINNFDENNLTSSQQLANSAFLQNTSQENVQIAVFMCANCKAVISDTFAYVSINRDLDLLILSDVTDFVIVGNQTFVETEGEFKGSSDLGLKYISTSTALDSLREYLCIKLDKVTITNSRPLEQNSEIMDLKDELNKTQESMIKLAERLLSLEQDFERLELKLDKNN